MAHSLYDSDRRVLASLNVGYFVLIIYKVHQCARSILKVMHTNEHGEVCW
jgi:hypothetical protein